MRSYSNYMLEEVLLPIIGGFFVVISIMAILFHYGVI